MSALRVPKVLKRLSRRIPDPLYIQLRYFYRFHHFCNLRDPQTYNEKLQWLKLNYRVAADAKLVDKYEVKRWVAERIGDTHLIPTLGIYDSVDEIDFEALPDSFVLKCTHDSGGVELVRDKSEIDELQIRENLQRSMSRTYFFSGREPHYLRIPPRIIAEPYVEDDDLGQLRDYKFFCFDGEVKALFVASDRATGKVKFDYFDADFTSLGIRQPYPNSEVPPQKPPLFLEMVRLAEDLSKGHPHVRVDLYEANGNIYFGELTFFHFSGFQPFKPARWDRTWGDWLTLPTPVYEY